MTDGAVETLRDRFPQLVSIADSPSDAVRTATMVVNATPIGLSGEDHPVRMAEIPPDAAVMDLAYRSGLTPWISAASFVPWW